MRICIVSDFFFPRLGGVELHQYSVAQCLIRRGHSVVVITGTYGTGEDGHKRQGVRYMSSGLKVYYCPQISIHSQASLPTLFSFFALFRSIVLRERIQMVHGHQTTSALAHECILHARTMGIPAVYTDHSLFGFANAGAIHLNKLMKFTLSNINHVVCVSHCMKENIVLRACVDPSFVSVIPNAIDATRFYPDPTKAPDHHERINIVIMSRLVYRKGVDLVVQVIPEICRRFPLVHFIIGGDGVKRLSIEEMRERYQLQDRVELLGVIPHNRVRDILVQGHIFLNCSLTEAFCIAIVEAVCCGLVTVCTRVGGVAEVLPQDENMVVFAEPNPISIIDALSVTIPRVQNANPQRMHDHVKHIYSWHDVAERTETVYEEVLQQPQASLVERLEKYYKCGSWAGKLFCFLAILDCILLWFLEWWRPAEEQDKAVEFPTEMYANEIEIASRRLDKKFR